MNDTKYFISVAAFISAVVIGFVALLTPPKGEIDKSVLIFIAQLLLFTSSLLGASVYFNKNEGVVKIGSDNQEV